MMELKDTVTMMNSEDYKERFKAEYYQTKIRYEKLKAFNNKIEAAHRTEYMKTIEMPKHDCPEDVLREQQALMGQYLHILEVRAVIEGIELEDIDRRSIQQEELKGTSPNPAYTPPSLFDYSKQTGTKEYDSTITCSNSPCCELAKGEVRID